MAESKRTGTGKAGTAQSSGSGASKQGARQRAKNADDSSAPTSAAEVVKEGGIPRNAQNVEGVPGTNWPGSGVRGDSDALIGHFATIVGDFKFEQDGEKVDGAGLYGVVQEVTKTGDHGEPVEARFEVATRSGPGIVKPDGGYLDVPWENLRRSQAGLR